MGGKCSHCGINDIRVLQIDHIVPLRRRTNGLDRKDADTTLSMRIIRGNRDNVQVLCANCHLIKTLEDRKRYVEARKVELKPLPLFDGAGGI
jgi:5-methylcytosine-specific restriction endonuclease McrA